MTLPATIRAGDSMSHAFEDSMYPASAGWTHTVELRGPAPITIPVTGLNTSFVVARTPGQSAGYVPGRYAFSRVATRTGERVTVESGVVEILPDLTAVTGNFDTRTHARRMLDAVEATLEGRATSDQLAIAIKGRSIQRTPMPELIILRDKYRAEAQREEAAAGLAPSNSRIRTVFVR